MQRGEFRLGLKNFPHPEGRGNSFSNFESIIYIFRGNKTKHKTMLLYIIIGIVVIAMINMSVNSTSYPKNSKHSARVKNKRDEEAGDHEIFG